MSGLLALRSFAQTAPSKLPGSVLLSHTDDTLTIFDAFPKALFHFLILPRLPTTGFTTAELTDLRTLLRTDKSRALALLTTLASTAAALRTDIECEMLKHYGFKWPILTGFHAVPSMAHLHLHVISDDFISDRLKVKKHYNSFHPTLGFFLPISDVLSWFDTDSDSYFSSMTSLDPKSYDPLLKEDLICWRCDTRCKNMPALKSHLQEEWDRILQREERKKKKKDNSVNDSSV
ncbi:HIT domain-containing protein [Mycena kentingensis (nom. inval.)]|nr:HIT domain-containing protein [Mycena kentingensis (nom. inval.)]